jgi:putative hydrolase of the HAD superfamily
MIKAVIFDIDNTLVDFMLIKKNCLEPAVDAMIQKGLKLGKKEAIDRIYKLYNIHGMEYKLIFQDLLNSINQFDYRILAAGIVAYRQHRKIRPYTGITKVLKAIRKKGIKLAIVSDAPNLKAWIRITYMRIEENFDVIVAFDDTRMTKPAKQTFGKALEKLGVRNDECLMVGDNLDRDIEGARMMGLRSCFARYGNPGVEKGKSGAEHEAEKPEDILRVIKEINHSKK